MSGSPWYTQDWIWLAIAAAVSASVAVATGFLALYTFRLAKETRKSLEQARSEMAAQERRHMDAFLPHIALIVQYLQEGHRDEPTVRIAHKVIAHNIGPGLAQKIEISVPEIDVVGNYIVDPPTGLASGESFEIATQPWNAQGPHLQDISVTYTDTFGRQFESRLEGIISPGSQYKWIRNTE